jgi:hypothetical protein
VGTASSILAGIITLQVMCINKRGNHYNPHERIQAIGGVDAGRRWKDPEDVAIRNIETGTKRYFVHAGGKSVWVVVAQHNGRKYLKTENDGYAPDNLLSLPECP